MAELAAHLVDRVLPEVPVRQWVLSMPWALRWRLACDPELCHAVARAFLRAVFASYRRRARAAGHLAGEEARAHPGAVNFTQRFGSSLALNVHFHALVLDGVYVTHGPLSDPVFHEAPLPGDDEVFHVQRDARRRIERVLRARGLLVEDGDEPPPAPDEQDSLLPLLKAAAVQSRAALGPDSGVPTPRLVDPSEVRADLGLPARASLELCASEAGYSLHAATSIRASDRDLLEHLCRYVARPPLAQGRLQLRDDGKVLWQLRRPWRNGTTAFVFKPLAFIERLAALVPHPREHLLTYHGCLAPASSLRDRIVPAPPPRVQDQDGADCHSECPAPRAQGGFTWAELLRRVFGEDVMRCRFCGGRRRRIAVITDPTVTRRILSHLGLRADPLPLEPARPPPVLPFGA